MSVAAVLMDMKTAFDTIWHPSLLSILSKLILSVSVIELKIYFISRTKSEVSVEGDVSKPRYKSRSPTRPRPSIVYMQMARPGHQALN